jgi:hypothetical protein
MEFLFSAMLYFRSYMISFTLGHSITAVDMGKPNMLIPVTRLPRHAVGRPLTIVVRPPGPMITSPVAVKLAMVATGAGI